MKVHHQAENMNLLNVCVRVESFETLQVLKELLSKYGEEIDDANFNTFNPDTPYILAAKWRLDGRWRIGASDRQRVPLWKIEKLLKPCDGNAKIDTHIGAFAIVSKEDFENKGLERAWAEAKKMNLKNPIEQK